jgi:hypothetical protein
MKTKKVVEDDECLICCDEKATDNLNCYKCNKIICISCCNKLDTRTSLLYLESKHIFIKYCCPFCRYCNNKHIKLFNKNEIVAIYTETLTQLSILQKYNDTLVNNYNQIYNENKRLQDEITNKNAEIAEITELLKDNASEAGKAGDENIEG